MEEKILKSNIFCMEDFMKFKKRSYKKIVGFYFFFSSLIIVTLMSVTFHYFTQKKLYNEIRENHKNLIYMASLSIDKEAFKRLCEKLPESVNNPKLVDEVENSNDYKIIYDHLNKIRDTNKGLILYVYTIVPTIDKNQVRFLVDADVLKLKKEKNKKELKESISHFGMFYDITNQPITKKAVEFKESIVSEKFVYDIKYNVNSVMGFAPIYDNNGIFLGVLGADISDKKASVFLNKMVILSFLIFIVSIIVLAILTLFLATTVSKPLLLLSEFIIKYSKKQFDIRADFRSSVKEIIELRDSFNSMADTIENHNNNLVNLNTSYERFIPVEFLNFLSKENIMQVKLGDQIQKDMAIMFSDIRFFTTLSESMTPKQTFNFLNSYLNRVGPVIRKNGGFIDKYLGDGVMALFPNSSDEAVQAAIEMRYEISKYNEERKKAGLIEIDAGIGIHLGTLILGTIGDSQRMQGTVISDSVNLASRLEGLTKEFGVSVIISKDIFDKLENPEKYCYRFLGNSSVKGKSEKTAVFEIYSADNSDLKELKNRTKIDFEAGVYFYNTAQFIEAAERFKKVCEVNDSDKIAKIYLKKSCDEINKCNEIECSII